MELQSHAPILKARKIFIIKFLSMFKTTAGNQNRLIGLYFFLNFYYENRLFNLNSLIVHNTIFKLERTENINSLQFDQIK